MQEENQKSEQQKTPAEKQEPTNSLPLQNDIQDLSPDDTAYLEKNYSKRLVGGATGLFLIIIIVLGLFFVTSAGMETSTFSAANLYDNYATFLKFTLAATAGLTLAYLAAHPIKPSTKYVSINTSGQQAANKSSHDEIWITFIIIGLMFFYIPGIILLIIYILNKKSSAEKPPDNVKEASGFRKVAVRPAVGAGTLLVAFILGAIPAFILGIIIGYPLSNHACSLSGSKYC